MNRNSDFFQTSLKIAERFLQTAVVIDDRAFKYTEAQEPVPEAIIQPPTPSSIDLTSEDLVLSADTPNEIKKELLQIPDPDPHGIDAEAVIKSFASHGIVCSVLQRFPDENPTDEGGRARRLLAPSDILVIDWQIHHPDGTDSSEGTLKFLESAVKESAQYSPEQLRVIIVYTGAQDLLKVAELIEARLKTVISKPPEKDGKFAFRVGAARIVVLGKFSRLRTAESSEQQVTDDEDLVNWATREFAVMTAGLVSNVVLSGLAAIREVTHRILSRFGPVLDSPFLAHRALLVPPHEGNSHLLPLIVSEFEAILEEQCGSELLSDTTILQWLSTRPDPKPMLADTQGVTTSEKARQVIQDLCIKGVGEHAQFAIPGQPTWVKKLAEGKSPSDLPKLTALIGAADSTGADEKLEDLMSLKPRYCDNPPLLGLGTLLKSKTRVGAALYWICLQPACDCFIRTGEPHRAFPFLALTPVANDQRFNLLALDGRGYVRLRWEPRPHKIRMFEFESNVPSKAVSSEREANYFRFKTVNKRNTFQWIGELKFPQAQRIAQALASESARVGLTESEWLRRNGR